MAKFTTLLTLLFLVSCGDIIQESVDKVASQTSGMMNFSAEFTEENIEGVWESYESHQFAEVHRLYDEAGYLKLDSFDRVSNSSLDTIEEEAKSCSLDSLNNDDIDFIVSRFYYEFKGDTYQYLARSKVTYRNGDETTCLFTIGAGHFSIMGSFVYLQDINKSLYIEILDTNVLFMGFSE